MLSLSSRLLAQRDSTLADAVRAARTLGFSALSVARAAPAPRSGDLAAARNETAVRLASLRAGCLDPAAAGRAECDALGSRDEPRRARAVESAREHAAFAESIGCPLVVLDGGVVEGAGLDDRVRRLEGEVDRGAPPGELLEEIRLTADRGRVAHMDRLCRSLHDVVRRNGGMRFALLPATRPHGVLNARALEDVLDDLRAPNLGAWIDVGASKAGERLGGDPLLDTLGRFAPRLVGLDLHDARGLADRRLPGEGEVDWRAVAEHAPLLAVRVLDLDAGTPKDAIVEARRVLESMGLG